FVLDVSSRNPATLQQVRDSRCVALEAKATEGATYRDPTLAGHRKIAAELGLPFGSYLFLHPSSSGSEADAYLVYAQPRPGDIQPVIDAEVRDGSSFQTVAARVESCARGLEARGYQPILYASASFWRQLFAATPDLKRLRVWEAQYPGRVTRWLPKLAAMRIKLGHGVTVVMWQFTDRYAVD